MKLIKGLTVFSFLAIFALVPLVRADIFYKNKLADGVDAPTFQVLDDGYAKDSDHVYFSWLGAINDSDIETFQSLGDSFAKDRNSIYYNGYMIGGASVESFQKIKGAYSKDLNSIFYEGQCLEEASLVNFEVLKNDYVKNVSQIFYQGELMEGVDVDTFIEMGDAYAKDKVNVYYKGEAIEVAKTDSFEILKNEYAVDSDAVYQQGVVMSEVDLEQAEMFDDFLLRDDSNIYALGANFTKLTLGADSVEKLNDFYYKIDSRVYAYQYRMLLETAINSESFEFLNKQYAKSGDNIYYLSHEIIGIDVDTFEVVGDDFAHDKNSIYYQNLRVEGASSGDVRIMNGDYFKIINQSLYDNLRGKIVLKVEDFGKAYYIHHQENEIYYLGRPEDAFQVMREQGVGITTKDLRKIPVGLVTVTGRDSDGDGLSDLLEDAIGTNRNNQDTDNDKYSDKDELLASFNPSGGDEVEIDFEFAEKQNGKIFLQVEQNGEAWYVNPADGKRYFLGRPMDAFSVMKDLGLGISNENFVKL